MAIIRKLHFDKSIKKIEGKEYSTQSAYLLLPPSLIEKLGWENLQVYFRPIENKSFILTLHPCEGCPSAKVNKLATQNRVKLTIPAKLVKNYGLTEEYYAYIYEKKDSIILTFHEPPEPPIIGS